MITIFCGDNIAASREEFNSLREEYREKGHEITDIPSKDITDLTKIVHDSASLFSDKRVFFIENVLSKKTQREMIIPFEDDMSEQIVIWEEKMQDRDLKWYFKKARILSSKLPHNIWKLLDGMYPGNQKNALLMLKDVSEVVDEHMILFMLQRRAKELLLIKHGLTGKRKLADWQKSRLSSQAEKWDEMRLEQFNDKLYEIEKGIKTGTMAYPAKKSLDILFCFYLQ